MQVRALFLELEPFLPDLLKRRRSGVLAALAGGAGRCGACQRELCAALAKALGALPQWAGFEGARQWVWVVCGGA